MEYMHVEGVADLLGHSPRWVHERVADGTIPHRRLAGIRRTLFVREDLDAWLSGVPLEAQALPGGGRIVRPVAS